MRLVKYLFSIAFLLSATFSFTSTAKAVVYTVNNLVDSTACSSSSCSLRGAIMQANATSISDRIVFDPSLSGPNILSYYTGGSSGVVKISAAGGDLSIEGNGTGVTFINGNNNLHHSPVLEIEAGANVEISNLSFVNGYKSGKVIENSGNLELTEVWLWGNLGRVIENNGVLRTFGNTRIFGNKGLAIYNYGEVYLNPGTVIVGNGNAGLVNEGWAALDNVKIEKNGKRGIENLGAGSYAEIFSSVISNNGLSTGNYPCVSNNQGSLMVVDSVIENCFGGVANSNGGDVVVETTTIQGQDEYGIYNGSNGDFELIDSVVTGGGHEGIKNIDSSLYARGSVISNNERLGVLNQVEFGTVEGGGETIMTLDHTQVIDNGGSGGRNSVNGYLTVLNESEISSNGWYGIENEGSLVIGYSYVEGNANPGIGNNGGGDVYIQRSSISNNSSGVVNEGKGIVNLEDSVVAGNSSAGVFNKNTSGASYVPVVNISGTEISGNGMSGVRGDGATETNIVNSWIDSNETTSYGGGGVSVSDGASVEILNTTISNNYAIYDALSCTVVPSEGGGGVRVDHSSATIVNSTISGNYADQYGGGINVFGMASNVKVISSTITNNVADYDDDSTSEVGGGIFNNEVAAYSGTVMVSNTILYGNENTEEPDCYGPISSGDYNVLGELSSCAFSLGTNDQVGLDPHMDDLESDGAFGPTHELLITPNSAAIDKIPSAYCVDADGSSLDFDQAGTLRNSYCDVGAYEVEDADDDLMPDLWEEDMGLDTSLDDSALDYDGDGYSNYEEYIGGTDAANGGDSPYSDYDGDGVEDAVDACPTEDASGYDTDLDGCLDDTDGDGYTDDVDIFPSDATEWADTDGDGYGDNSDVFPADSSEWVDADGDGYGDNSDVCAGTTDYSTVDSSGCSLDQLDTDNDTVTDDIDACPTEDASGYDTDLDGCIDDLDGDGLYADEESSYGSSDSDTDSDDDGLNDYEEVYTYGTDPINEDTDGDGMDDAWELTYGFDPVYIDESGDDEDSDGFTNLEEYDLLFDPTLAALIMHDADTYASATYGTCSALRDGDNIATDTSVFVEGSGSISFDADVSLSGYDSVFVACSPVTSFDLSSYFSGGGEMKFWVYIPDVTDFSQVDVILATGAGYTHRWSGNIYAPTNNDGVYQNGWNLVDIDFSSLYSTGTPDAANIDRFEIAFIYDSTYVDQTGLRLDVVVIE